MAINIIEQACIAKHPALPCEDICFCGSRYLAVIDGVSAKSERTWKGKRSGLFAADCLRQALENMPDCAAQEGIAYLNHALAEACREQREWLAAHPLERPMAAVILYHIQRNEIWSFGDCACIVNGKAQHFRKKVDAVTEQARAMYVQARLLEGHSMEALRSPDAGRAYILPLLQLQAQFANGEGEFAYDILDGFDIHPERVQILHPDPGSEAVLASDGYPQLLPSLAESEAALARLLAEDPLCIHANKQPKCPMNDARSFDDRCYIRFQILPN